MKKFKKAIVALAMCAVAATGAAGLAACGGDKEETTVSGTVEGEYSYYASAYYTTYGVKVSVTVEDGVITSVTIVDSEYTEATSSDYWSGNADYYAARDSLLQAYVGKTVDDVLALTVAIDAESGEPLIQTDSGFSNFGDDLIIAGSTQSSGRLLLAVQNALKQL